MISYDHCAISYENCAIIIMKKKKTSRVGGIFRVGRVTPIQQQQIGLIGDLQWCNSIINGQFKFDVQ